MVEGLRFGGREVEAAGFGVYGFGGMRMFFSFKFGKQSLPRAV